MRSGFHRCCQRLLAALVVAAFALPVWVGCEDDVPAPPPPPPPDPVQPDVELPAPEPTGPLGPIVTQDLGFAPPLEQPGLPAILPGGTLLLTDPRRAPFLQEEVTHRLHAIETRPDHWTRKNRYAAPNTLVPFTVETVPEIVAAFGSNSASREFAVLFRRGTAWLGPFDGRRAMFELPREGEPRWDGVTALGVFGPRSNRLLLATGAGIWAVTVTPAGDETSRYEKISDHPVISIAGLPERVAFALTADGSVLQITGESDEEGVIVWTVAPFHDAAGDAGAGPARAVQAVPGASGPVVAVRHDSGLRFGDRLYDGRVALLPGGLLARLDDAGTVTVFRASAPDQPLAQIEGMPANADWFGADPAGGTLVAIRGQQLAICVVSLKDPAFAE